MQFYTALFGWQFETVANQLSTEPYFLIKSGKQYIAGMLDAGSAPEIGNISRWVGYLSVDDVDKSVNFNLKSGGHTALAATDINGIGRVARIVDPQGAVFGVSNSNHSLLPVKMTAIVI